MLLAKRPACFLEGLGLELADELPEVLVGELGLNLDTYIFFWLYKM